MIIIPWPIPIVMSNPTPGALAITLTIELIALKIIKDKPPYTQSNVTYND
ncbi:hypothetical protein [Thermococcus prieurii]